ncbi:MAG: molecular chaperone HtpG, partial [Alphaproteobacteria bacterium]|nr:molecular chaperone HtpG [Alphaproteobacteria bacterium]
ETLSFNAEVSKVLHLMIHSLYTNKDIFVRELVSNASDACDKLRYQAQSDAALLKDDPELKIRISCDAKHRTLTIQDNGIGMNRDELVSNLGTIARSGTQEFMKNLADGKDKGVELIGQFGVGFYSAFIVSEKVEVESRKAGDKHGWRWVSDGAGEFTIEPVEENVSRGTKITLHLKKEEKDYLDEFRIGHIIKTYSDHISIPVMFVGEKGTETLLNSSSALWMRSKSDITEAQYKEFYHAVAHSPDDPWMTIHNKAEGKIEYTNLLFIPSMPPFDLFHPDRRRRVKLYIKRVFITDDGIDLIPQWLRFLRGVVDSEDLPLNISRETLQHNAVLDKIRQGLVKRVLGDLKKRADKDAESYETFWLNFGAVLKEGLCEQGQEKQPLLEVCRFYSTKSGEDLISLDQYIERMKEGQGKVYYLTGENRETMLKSPQLEGFIKRGIEVLLFTDHVDDFWVNVVHQYKEKEMESVTRATLSDDEDDAQDKKSTDESEKKTKADIDNLLSLLQAILSGDVKQVRVTHKLADSPVCLAVGEGDMDIRIERFLSEQKQLPGTSARILEINPKHPLILTLAKEAASRGKTEQLTDAAWLLLDQARILEGETIRDPGAFSRRLTAFMGKGWAA